LPRTQSSKDDPACNSCQPEIGSLHSVITPLFHACLNVHPEAEFMIKQFL
jgi:hypothetical protein